VKQSRQMRHCRPRVPVTEFTRGYPVLGINFLTPISGLETCPDWGASQTYSFDSRVYRLPQWRARTANRMNCLQLDLAGVAEVNENQLSRAAGVSKRTAEHNQAFFFCPSRSSNAAFQDLRQALSEMTIRPCGWDL
jgi:hypothetical protein